MNRRLILFFTIVVLSLLGGLFPSQIQTRYLLEHLGYYFIFVLVLCWLFFHCIAFKGKLKETIERSWKVFFASVLATGLIFISSPPKFKILADEANLIGASMMMHNKKKAVLPVDGLVSKATGPELSTHPSRRPLAFPFFVSVIHALIGYSPYNGLLLNFICSCAVLVCFYFLITLYFSSAYGYLGILLFFSCPIYIICATSSGFEILNVFFLIFSFLVLSSFLENTAEFHRISLLVLSLLILAQSRYESAIILPVILLFLLPTLVKNQFLNRMPWIICISPIFTLPMFWQRRVYWLPVEYNKVGHGLYQLTDSLFSSKAFFSNFDNNIFVLLGLNPDYGFTPLIGVLSVCGSYLIARKQLAEIESRIPLILFLSAAISALALFVIISCFFWGSFTLPVNNRLSLVYLPFMVFTAVFFSHSCISRLNLSPAQIVFLIGFCHIVLFMPYGLQQRMTESLSLQHEYNRSLQYLKDRQLDKDHALVLAEQPNLYVIHGYSSYRCSDEESIKNLIPLHGRFDHILAFQKFDKSTGKPHLDSKLPDVLICNEKTRFSLSNTVSMKISECGF